MAKIEMRAQALIVTSSLTFEDIKTVLKYRPNAAVLMGGEDNKDEVFRLNIAEPGEGGINKFGVSFDSETRGEEKLAVLTFTTDITGDAAAVKSQLADKYGEAMANLNELEAKLKDEVAIIKADRAAFMESITVA